MTVQIRFQAVWWASALLVALSCGPPREARTAEEFVELYASAWEREDVDAILSLEYDLSRFDASRIPPGKEVMIVNYRRENVRKKVENDIEGRGFGYRMNVGLKYVSSQAHGDHIHVRVAQGAANADILLLRDGEVLKLFPYPSWFD